MNYEQIGHEIIDELHEATKHFVNFINELEESTELTAEEKLQIGYPLIQRMTKIRNTIS